MKKKIRWGILGTSYISEVMAKAIKESSLGELKAIASRDELKAKNFADQFSIPTYFSSYESLINDAEVDAVYIGLPNHLHKEWIIKSARNRKHILCEKPLVLDVSEFDEAYSIVKQMNVLCMEALMYRHHPFIKEIEAIVNSHLMGEIKLYSANYSANIADLANKTAGGSIRNLGCYPISLIRLLAKAEPVQIKALARMNPQTESDHQACCLLQFANESMAMVSTADDLNMSWHFEIHGTKGSLKFISNPWLPNLENNIALITLCNEKPYEIKVSADKSLYAYQIEHMNMSIIEENFTYHNGVSLKDSLGNINVLQRWLVQTDMRQAIV